MKKLLLANKKIVTKQPLINPYLLDFCHSCYSSKKDLENFLEHKNGCKLVNEFEKEFSKTMRFK